MSTKAKLADIYWRPISQLCNWERNYRHGDVEAIANSIRRYGFNQTLRVRGSTVMAGNHALKALRLIQDSGYEPPKNIRAQNGEWLAPCLSIDHLEESEAMGFAIADNRIPELGENDDAALRELLQELSDEDPDALDVVGFDASFLYAAADDPENRIAGKQETAEPLAFLKWGRTEVQISDEERQGLDAALAKYQDERGTSFGFARSILGL